MKQVAVRYLSFVIVQVMLSGGFCGSGVAQTVSRGPYLQLGTPSSVVVRWRTDSPTNSVVRFGPEPGSLDTTVTLDGSRTEHEVAVTGLAADTRYYYSVGDSTGPLEGDSENYFFATSPVPNTQKPTRIWVIGDSGTADASANAVRDAYKTFNGSQVTDLWLMLGDNAYNHGTDAEYQTAVFDTYPELLQKIILWPTLGNHDAISANSATESGPYYDIFTLPRAAEAGGVASGTEAYYSFDYGNIHFVVLDSHETNRSVEGAMLTWLVNDLAANDKEWLIAFWHHPPYSMGSHDSDLENQLMEMRQNALPILEDYGVDIVLSGHSHSYERSYLIDGHYGTSGTLTDASILDNGSGREDTADGTYTKLGGGPVSHDGAVYAVAGSSGKIGGGLLNHPAMYISLNQLGSMVFDVSGERLDAQFLDSTGTVQDYFTIVKEPNATSLAVVKAGSGNGTVTSSPDGINCGSNCSTIYDLDTVVTLTATPDVGSVFSGWSGGNCSGTGACTVTMDMRNSVMAIFAPVSTLTVAKAGSGDGTVTSSPAGINCGATCQASFSGNTSVTLTATPATGSFLNGWSGAGCSGTDSCTVIMNANKSVTAGFSLTSFTFTDEPLTVGVTPIKKVHISELRTATNQLRSQGGLGPFPFTDPTLAVGVTTVKGVHITELRTALTEAAVALSKPAPNFPTNPTIVVRETEIKAAQIQEMRNSVRALE